MNRRPSATRMLYFAAVVLSFALAAASYATRAPAAAAAGRPARPQQMGQAEVRRARHSDTSPRLPDIPRPAVSLGLGREIKPIRLNPNRTVNLALQPDGALQSSFGAAHPGQTVKKPFDGLGSGFIGPQGAFEVKFVPPDTTGAVGATQYVQWVNAAFAIFDKKTGKPVFGPVQGNTLWQGLGGDADPSPCATNNDGDPVVQYDKAAGRWLLSQFSVSKGKFAQCIAVSQTSDALGPYFRYDFAQPAFNDYPKLGVWPDGYYASYNMFDGLSGGRACAYERAKMLVGDPSAMEQCFQLANTSFGLMPSDLDGPTPPPAGSPDYFVALGFTLDTLDLWRFHVDWANPANTTFGKGATHQPDATLNAAHYNYACSGSGATCVPQAGTTQQLDTLGERLMFRLAYRNMDTHESLLVNHSVDTGPPNSRTGVRWYEIRNPSAAAPAVFQQGTYAPDSKHRWMGSIAMDRAGNIVLGYNVSGSVSPGIALTSRSPKDPPGRLGAEVLMVKGAGSQSASGGDVSRWGDYSGLTLDPADDCTFWYTAEYGKENATSNWHTSIFAFKLKKCK